MLHNLAVHFVHFESKLPTEEDLKTLATKWPNPLVIMDDYGDSLPDYTARIAEIWCHHLPMSFWYDDDGRASELVGKDKKFSYLLPN